MLQIRRTKTASNNTAVQVVFRHNHKTEIIKHIGTGRNEREIKDLFRRANQYIAINKNIPPLLPQIFYPTSVKHHLVDIENLKFTANYHDFAYEFLSHFYTLNGFNKIESSLLKDLSLIRIIEPSSKLKAVSQLAEYFRIVYPINRVYSDLRSIIGHKREIEKIAVQFAKTNLSFDFTLVFYDVTTLYFETFKEDRDNFKRPGFSKDGKSQQPQILLGLMVTKEGYPIGVEMFEGNTFEGHTIIPVIEALKKTYDIKKLTVVADAGMLSDDNIKALKNAGLSFIVGARLGNIEINLLKKISLKLNRQENTYDRRKTSKGTLICNYSIKRANKDKSDRDKQIKKARAQINNPEKVKKRSRFVKEQIKSTFILNNDLIRKDKIKEGIKGYYTNLKWVKSRLIVDRYHDLWQVEKSFRITKSDLEARPIFHHKKENIKTHILIVFVSLCISKIIELTTGYSIKKVRDNIWRIIDVELVDSLTEQKFIKRMDISTNKEALFLQNYKRFKRVLKK